MPKVIKAFLSLQVCMLSKVCPASILPLPCPLRSLVCWLTPQQFAAGVEAHVQGQTQNVCQMADSPYRTAP